MPHAKESPSFTDSEADPSSAPATLRAGTSINRVPTATYRLQLRSDFDLDEVRNLLPYLRKLGISDVYLSPLFRAREESSHGYDVVDHGTIEPAFGGLPAFQRLAEAVRDAGMGLLLDVVPNHMGINDPANVWWWDVLENGEASPYAEFFDIDWQPAATSIHHRVLLPCLGSTYGETLERGELQIGYANERFELTYFTSRFPLSLPTITFILDLILAELGGVEEGDPAAGELSDVLTELRHLSPLIPGDADAVDSRRTHEGAALQRFAALVEREARVRSAMESVLARLNGEPGNPRSFDQLEQLIDQQWYRLAYWRVASDEINYRRFFDINELAAIRVEDPRVFEAVHRLVGLFLEKGWVTGLRIDHPDGLLDPKTYFSDLQRLHRVASRESDSSQIYILAEKILAEDEQLPEDWDVCGTTGYDLLNLISRLLVSHDGLGELRSAYEELSGVDDQPADVLYESKRTILLQSMASELQMLTSQLYRIAEQHRSSRDFTRPALQRALREVIASLSVYRSYVRPAGWDVSETDYRRITTAVRWAKRRNRAVDYSVFDFIAGVLLLQIPPTLTPEQAAEWRRFTLKFQQVSGPVAAKGVEDTAFYRFYPLAAMNEVGGELESEGLDIGEFHRLMRHRAEEWPHAMSATATHDTKRGEDFRARLLVLAEIPEKWRSAVARWRSMNSRLLEEVDGEVVPSRNEEYFIYQTLVGTWPLGQRGADMSAYSDRIIQYMEKVLREAKQHSSWLNPDQHYEQAVFTFVRALLAESSSEFRDDLTKFVEQIATAGFANSLSQLALKLTLPGVPDFYQGTEFWDFSLVDPDNRRPVDFRRRESILSELLDDGSDVPSLASKLHERWPDPQIKLFLATRGLWLRDRWRDVYSAGEYIPICAEGRYADRVIAFARRAEGRIAVTVVARQMLPLLQPDPAAPLAAPQFHWDNTAMLLPDEVRFAAWTSLWTGETISSIELVEQSTGEPKPGIPLQSLLDKWPAAILISEPLE